jgi:hypothetical protein
LVGCAQELGERAVLVNVGACSGARACFRARA